MSRCAIDLDRISTSIDEEVQMHLRPSPLTIASTCTGLLAIAAPASWAQRATTPPTKEFIGTTSTDAQVAEELKNACEDIARRVSATDVVDAQSYTSGCAATVVAALVYAPGALARAHQGQGARLSFRGSGIQLCQDGIAQSQTDGSTDFQSIDPAYLAMAGRLTPV